MREIIAKTPFNVIDLFSLDVEGAEFGVLDSFDWSVPIHVFTVERAPESASRVSDLLLSKGFEYVREHGADRVWVNSSWWRARQADYARRTAAITAALPSTPLVQRKPYSLRGLPLQQSRGVTSWTLDAGCRGKQASGEQHARCWTKQTDYNLLGPSGDDDCIGKVHPRPNTSSHTYKCDGAALAWYNRARSCGSRYLTLEEAKVACQQRDWCRGVTRDGGPLCHAMDE
eukprot:139373-Prymnesium_polylepis.1